MAISNSGRLGVVPPETFTSAPGFSPASPAITSRSNSPSLPPPPNTVSPVYTSEQVTPSTQGTGQPSSGDLSVYLAGREPTPGTLPATNRTVAIGTTADAVISTPVLWPGNGYAVPGSRDPNTPKYVVQLEEALTSTDGGIIFPKEAKLVVAVAPLDPLSGIATLDVLSVIREEDGQSFMIPQGQLMVRGQEGKPLEARRLHDPGGSIFAMDLGLFAVSGLAEVGALMDQSEEQTTNSFLFPGLASPTYGFRDYLGAVLEDGSRAIAARMAERNSRAIQELALQPQTWYLPEGTRVQLFVNQTMLIP